MNTCDTWEFNSAKAKALRLKAEAHRWDARVCELLGDAQGALDNRTVADDLDKYAAGYDKWAREAPDAPPAIPPTAPVVAADAQRVAVVPVVNMADARPAPTVHVVADSPRQREAMASHLESLALAMRRGAALVSGALYTMGPLHLAGEIQLGEPAARVPDPHLYPEGMAVRGYANLGPRQAPPAAAVPGEWVAIVGDLVRHIERETCTHEETHRGGAIWEICDSCGAKWADDKGGKPEFTWPACVETARAMLASAQGVKS